MVALPDTNGAHYDSVNSQNILSSKSIRMGVKIPVQPSNFDALQKGASLGASVFIEHDKNHIYQRKYTSKYIPSPGTIFRRTRLWRVFCFLRYNQPRHRRQLKYLIINIAPEANKITLMSLRNCSRDIFNVK